MKKQKQTSLDKFTWLQNEHLLSNVILPTDIVAGQVDHRTEQDDQIFKEACENKI